MIKSLRLHWPEYLMEAALLGAFMVSACFVTVALEHLDQRGILRRTQVILEHDHVVAHWVTLSCDIGRRRS